MNAEVLWAGQRAQIVAGPHGNPPQDLFSTTPRIQLELTNKGATPAYDVVYETWFEILPRPFGDFTSNATYFKDIQKVALYPNVPMKINIPLGKQLTETEHAQLKHWDLHACVRIRVGYRDARGTGRYADFGFHIKHDGLGFLPKYQAAN